MKRDSIVVPKRPRAAMLGYFQFASDLRVRNYANILTDHGYEVDVFGLGKEDYTSECPNGERVTVYALQNRIGNERGKKDFLFNILRFFWKATRAVTHLNRTRKYELIHVHNVPDFLVFTTFLAKRSGAKVLLDIHDILPEFFARKFNTDGAIVSLLKYVEKWSCRFADHVIVANDVWRDTLTRRSVGDRKCTSIINFPDPRSFFPIERPIRSEGAPFKIYYHGSYTEHHGLDIAREAIAILKNRYQNFKFITHGKGPFENEMRRLIIKHRIEAYVEMRPLVPLHEVPRILQDADLGIVPKKNGVFVGDALSTKLFQYTCMGIPSVVSRTAAELRYFNEDEVMYFTPGDPAEMAKCMESMIRNPAIRQEFAQKAQKRSTAYNLSVSSRKYMEILGSVLGK